MPRHPALSLLPAALVAACANVKRMLPGKPVISGEELAEFAPAERPGVRYLGPRRVGHPVIPLQAFGLYYGLDLVVVSRHPRWDMHEYARIDTPEGPLWMAKDSDLDGVQTIVADVPDIETMVAEMPVPRVRGALQVEDRSAGREVDVSLAYTNVDGEPVTLEFRGRVPARPPSKRSGSTMGHSRQAAAVVLDIERQGLAGAVEMTIGGERQGVDRLLGLYPLKFVLLQDQAGLAVTSFRTEATPEGLRLTRPAGAGETDPATGAPGWPTRGVEDWVRTGSPEDELQTLTHDTGLSRYQYTFLDGGLAKVVVSQWSREGRDPLTLWLQPALPDLARPFEGVAESRFRADVNGQLGHGEGVIRAWWAGEDTVRVEIRPRSPWWFADRPMDGTIRFPEEGGTVVQIVRVPTEPAAPTGEPGTDPDGSALP